MSVAKAMAAVEVVMKRLLPVLIASLLAVLLLGGVALAQSKPEFRLGFKALADLIPDVVGDPLENEHWGTNGDSLQRTTRGLMVWRKADNWTAFTDGARTWANGPLGIQERSVAAAPRLSLEGSSNVYIGAIHSMHTSYSDGGASYPEGFYSMLKPLWDWAATTDHDLMLSDGEWRSMVENARKHNDERFVSFVGYEWTSPTRGTMPSLGHMSVVFRGYDRLGDRVPGSASDPLYDSPDKMYPVVEGMDGLMAFAHPNRDGSIIDFKNERIYRNGAVAPLVSVVNGGVSWSRNWEYARGSGIHSERRTSETSDLGWPRLALDRGYRLGFVGEYDGHASTIQDERYAYTGVVAGSSTRDEIFDGLKARHTYAVYSPYGVGKRIMLKASSGGFLMGDAFRAESNPLKIRLQGKTDLVGFRAVSLVVNGRIEEERFVSGSEVLEEFSVPLPAGNSYVFFIVLAENPHDPRIQDPVHRSSVAFTSPMFVTVER